MVHKIWTELCNKKFRELGERDKMKDLELDVMKWVHEHGGLCCLCVHDCCEGAYERRFDELHHYEPRGIGLRGESFKFARLCKKHHQREQGKGRLAYERSENSEILTILQRDNVDILIGFLKEGGSNEQDA